MAPWQQRKLGAAPRQVVKDLIGSAVLAIGHGEKLFHVVGIEIGDAPVSYLAVALQSFESRHGFVQRVLAAPVQQIEIDMIGAKPCKAALAGLRRAFSAGVPRVYLADQKHVVTAAGNCRADHLFGSAIGIHFGSIDQRHAEIDRLADALDLLRSGRSVFSHVPGAKAKGWNLFSGWQGNGRNVVIHCFAPAVVGGE